MEMKKGWILILSIVSTLYVYGQHAGNAVAHFALFQDEDEGDEDEERRGFGIAVNVGVYFGHNSNLENNSALFYNGACLYELAEDLQGVRCYTIQERLQLGGAVNSPEAIIANYYNATGIAYPSDMHPFSIRYNPAFIYGIHIDYYFNDLSLITANLNTVQLKAQDQFTLNLIGTGQQLNGQNDTRLFPIFGEETRLHVTTGLRQGWEIADNQNWYLELGGTFLATRVESNYIRVADQNWDLLLNGTNPQQTIGFTPQARTGFGYYFEAGYSMLYNDTYKLDLGVQASRDRVRVESFDNRIWNWGLYLRFGV